MRRAGYVLLFPLTLVDPGLVIMSYITGHQLKPEQKLEMVRYLRSKQNADGGWGLCVSARYGS